MGCKIIKMIWLVGCLDLMALSEQYFNLYQAGKEK